MDGIDNNIMQEAAEKVIQHQRGFYEIHTVTIVMNDASPEITIQGFTSDELDEHLTITYWKGEKTVSWERPS